MGRKAISASRPKSSKIGVRRAALALGLLFSILHLIVALLITSTRGGIVEYFMDMHYLKMAMTYPPLDIGLMLFGTVQAFILGALPGGLFAAIWNGMEG